MNDTPLEDRVHDGLHRTVDPMQRTPLTVTDVRARARRIQRRRAVAAGAAVAAALAVAVPVGLTLTSRSPRSEIPPVTQTPTPTPVVTGPVRIDPVSADVSETPPGAAVVDLTRLTVVAGSTQLDLPRPYEQLTPYRDGWIGATNDGGLYTIDVLDSSFAVSDQTRGNSQLTVSPDGSRVAWAFHDRDHWSIVNNDVAGQEQERPWSRLPDGPDGSYVGVVGFVSDSEVLVSQLDERTGTSSYVLADGDQVVPLPWLDQPASTSPATGMIAARATVSGGASCSATFDGRTRSEAPLWTDCDHELGPFSPDGTHVVGFAPTPDGDHPGLSLLDATDGTSLVDFEVTTPQRHVVGIASQAVWEDDEHVLAVYTDNAQQYVVRLGLDGSVERVAGPVTAEPGDYPLRVTPGDVR